MNPAIRHNRLNASISIHRLHTFIATVLLAGCVSPPTTSPAFPNSSISLHEDGETFFVVDAGACCRTAGDFKPEQLSLSRIGLSEAELEPVNLDALTAETDSTVALN